MMEQLPQFLPIVHEHLVAEPEVEAWLEQNSPLVVAEVEPVAVR